MSGARTRRGSVLGPGYDRSCIAPRAISQVDDTLVFEALVATEMLGGGLLQALVGKPQPRPQGAGVSVLSLDYYLLFEKQL